MPGSTDRPHGRARKRFGQHFLEPAWARKVVDAIAPAADAAVLEIGPGRGAITRLLAERSGWVLAYEIDRDLVASLRAAAIPRVHVVEGDFLRLTVEDHTRLFREAAPGVRAFRVAGNLPYNVASPIMFRLVDLVRAGLPITDATLMLQREVADRLLAGPGGADYGLLTVLIRHRATVRRLLNLPPGAFRPAPAVQSTVVRLDFHDPQPPVRSEPRLAAVTLAVFSRRRKTLANALLAYEGMTPARAASLLASTGIDPVRRPETLTIEEFGRLADALT
jgi:16S rRNA (adenine1518-N6/adenine1519-N6)-dimethyltransferase